jgi:hypothetical protein
MVKLLRAHGECLGARKRRRAWLAAISFGEPQAGVDPEIPEWGNPTRVIPRYLLTEYIGLERQTRGTETSKYPEEKKSNRDSASSGERKRNSLNRRSYLTGSWGRLGVNPGELTIQRIIEPTGKRAIEGDSPVD